MSNFYCNNILKCIGIILSPLHLLCITLPNICLLMVHKHESMIWLGFYFLWVRSDFFFIHIARTLCIYDATSEKPPKTIFYYFRENDTIALLYHQWGPPWCYAWFSYLVLRSGHMTSLTLYYFLSLLMCFRQYALCLTVLSLENKTHVWTLILPLII